MIDRINQHYTMTNIKLISNDYHNMMTKKIYEIISLTSFYYDEMDPIIKYRPNVELKQTHYNFKLSVRANRMDDTVAELDSDSHISLVSEEYFLKLKTYLSKAKS